MSPGENEADDVKTIQEDKQAEYEAEKNTAFVNIEISVVEEKTEEMSQLENIDTAHTYAAVKNEVLQIRCLFRYGHCWSE